MKLMSSFRRSASRYRIHYLQRALGSGGHIRAQDTSLNPDPQTGQREPLRLAK